MPWTDLSNEELIGYLKKGYIRFYFRPSQILRIIFRIKSIDELFRYIAVSLKMVMFLCKWRIKNETPR
jgi:hypothetical protein